MSNDHVRGARGYVRNRTEETHVRPCGTNMGYPEQKRIQERGETVAIRPRGTSGREPRKPTFARAGRTWGTPSKSESKTAPIGSPRGPGQAGQVGAGGTRAHRTKPVPIPNRDSHTSSGARGTKTCFAARRRSAFTFPASRPTGVEWRHEVSRVHGRTDRRERGPGAVVSRRLTWPYGLHLPGDRALHEV
jgi:hypothetical protein